MLFGREENWIVRYFADCFESSDDLDLRSRWPVDLILIGFIKSVHVFLALLRNNE